MKIGMRKPSFKKSFSAKTKGRVTRTIKKSYMPSYGQKGMGYVKDPKRAVKNAVYQKATYSAFSSGSSQKQQANNTGDRHVFWPILIFIAAIVAPIWMLFKGYSLNTSVLVFVCGFLLAILVVSLSTKKEHDKQLRMEEASFAQKQRSFLMEQIEGDMRVYQESLTLCGSTKDLDTLFSRFDVASAAIDRLRSRHLPAGVSITESNLNELPEKLKQSKSLLVRNCIEKAHKDTIEKASSLKTERGKRARLERFYGDLLSRYVHQLTDEEIQYVKSLAETAGVAITIKKPTVIAKNETHLLDGPDDRLGVCSRCKKAQPKTRKMCFYCETPFVNPRDNA